MTLINAKDARVWLEQHAELYGEQSPMNGCVYLPYGRKSEYFALYSFERSREDLSRLDFRPATQVTFFEAWRVECPHIQIASRTSMFVACSVCKLLQSLISSTGRDNDDLLKALRHRLGKHYAFQAAQRLCDEKLMEQARRSQYDEW